MGYWGWVVIAKGDAALAHHAAVSAYGQDVLEDLVRGEWREFRLDGPEDEDRQSIGALAAATGAPALAVYIADEDCAVAYGASPSGGTWTGVFHERAASEYDALPPGYRRQEAVKGALAWATEAGLTADAEKVTAALADGWYSDLLPALGLPAGVQTASA